MAITRTQVQELCETADGNILLSKFYDLVKAEGKDAVADAFMHRELARIFEVIYGFPPRSSYNTKGGIINQLMDRAHTQRWANAFPHINPDSPSSRRLSLSDTPKRGEPVGPDCKFSTNLRRVMEAKELSPEILARSLQLRAGLIREWEDDESEPTLQQLVTLAHVLGVTTDSLLL